MTDPAATPLDSTTADNDHEVRVLLAKHGISTDQVEAARAAANGKAIFLLNDQPVIFKRASADQLQRVFTKPEKDRYPAMRDLAGFLVVHPAPEAWKVMTGDDGFPLLFVTVVDAASAIASGKATSEAKKL